MKLILLTGRISTPSKKTVLIHVFHTIRYSVVQFHYHIHFTSQTTCVTETKMENQFFLCNVFGNFYIPLKVLFLVTEHTFRLCI
jgi:hypothetical protein